MGIKKNGGFSLIESMVATTVLSVGLLGLIGMFQIGYKALDGGERRSVASTLVRNQMEAIRSRPALLISPPQEDFPEGMRRQWTMIKDPADANIWVITVEVFWKNVQGQDQNISMKSLRSI